MTGGDPLTLPLDLPLMIIFEVYYQYHYKVDLTCLLDNPLGITMLVSHCPVGQWTPLPYGIYLLQPEDYPTATTTHIVNYKIFEILGALWLTGHCVNDREVLSYHKSSKIFYKVNLKRPLVSILWYKHSGSCRNSRSKKHSAMPCVSLWLLSCSTAPSMFISWNIDTRVVLYPLNTVHFHV